MSNIPIVNPGEKAKPIFTNPKPENLSSDCCKKHCHYPAVRTGSYSASSSLTLGCICMENHRDCNFAWGESGRGFCRYCHHANSLTIKNQTAD